MSMPQLQSMFNVSLKLIHVFANDLDHGVAW